MARPQLQFDALTHPAEFYFIRHGESAGNQARKIQGHTDSPLTNQGREQAAQAGIWLKARQIERIIASPLSRARETATIIATTMGLPEESIINSDLIKELDTGIFSNKSFAEVEEQHNAAWRAFRYRSWESVPEAERIEALLERATLHWNNLISLANAGTTRILSVTHGGFFQWLFRASFGPSHASWMPLVHLDNCGLSSFFIEPVAEAPPNEPGRIFAEWRQVNFTGFSAVRVK